MTPLNTGNKPEEKLQRIFQFENKQEALDKFDELSKNPIYESVYLILSDHWASKGYWVECFHHDKKPNLGELDFIIKRFLNKY